MLKLCSEGTFALKTIHSARSERRIGRLGEILPECSRIVRARLPEFLRSSREESHVGRFPRKCFSWAILLGILLQLARPGVHAQFTWNTTLNNQDWSVAGNWTPVVGAPPNAVGATATFGSIITANRNVDVNIDVTLGTLTIGDNNRYTLRDQGGVGTAITFEVTGVGNAALTDNGTSLQRIRVPIILNDTLEVTNDDLSNLQLQRAISGNGGLILLGGRLTFNQTGSNTYSGLTQIQVGRLQLNKNGAIAIAGNVEVGDGIGLQGSAQLTFGNFNDQISNSSRVTIFSDGRLDLTNEVDTIGSLASSGASAANGQVFLGGGTLTIGGDNTDSTFDGVISETGSIVKTGSGRLALTNNNTYTGATTVSGGFLRISDAGALGNATGDTTVSTGGTLELTNGISVASDESLTLSGTGNGGVGALRNVSGSNTWAGAVDLDAAATIASDAGTLTISGTVDNDAFLLTVEGAGDTTISGVISDTGGLTKAGNGTLSLSGGAANTYGGITTVDAGTVILNKTAGDAIAGNLTIGDGAGTDTVQLSAANQIADTSAVTVNASGVFDLNDSDETIGSLAGVSGAQVTLGTGGDLTVGDATNTTFAGVISETGNVTKQGSGRLTLSGNNTYTGATNVNGGFLQISNAGALGDATGNTAVSTGGSLELTSGILIAAGESLTLSGSGNGGVGALRNVSGSNTWSDAVDLDAAATIASDAGTLTISGTVDNDAFLLTVDGAGDTTISSVISDTGGLTKTGSGRLTLSGNNTYTGTTNVNGGFLQISNAGALGDATGDTTVSTGGTLELTNGISVASSESLTLSGTGNGVVGALRNVSGSNTWAGAVDLDAAATIASDAGTLTISGTVDNDAFLLTLDGAGNTTISGVISDTGGLTKDGTGTLTLSGGAANTFGGLTTVNTGTVLLNKSSGDAIAGNLTIGDGAGTDTVQLSAANQIANTSAVSLDDSGVFDLNNFNETIGSLATLSTADTSANVDLGSAFLTVGDGTSTEFSGTITGTGSIEKTGSGTLTLSGTNANTYSGATTVSEGTLILSKTAGVDAIAGDLTIGNGVGTDTVRLATSNQINNSSNINFIGGVLEMNGNSDTVGTADVNQTSTVDFAGNPAATVSSLTFADSSAVSWNAAALFQFDNWNGLLAGSGDDRLVYSGGGVSEDQLSQHRFLNYDSGSGSMTHLANLLGSGEVVPLSGNKFIWQPTGGGDWNTGSNWDAGFDPDNILARATIGNSITTNATISAATDGAITLNRLTFDNASGNNVTVNNTIDFTFSNDGTTDPQIVVDTGETGDYTIAGGVALSDDLTVNQGGSGSLTLSGDVSETSAGQTVTKTGSGTLVLSGTNTYTGSTTINAGTVSISADSGLGTAPGAATAGHLTFGGGTLNSTATFTLNSNRGIQLNSGSGTIDTDASTTLTYGGTMAGTGNFTKSGSGTLVLSTSNTYTGGTTVSAGTLEIENADALGGGASAVQISPAATLALDSLGGNFTRNINFTNGSGSGVLQNLAGNNTVDGDITLNNTTSSSKFTASSGNTLTVTGNITGSGGLTLDSGGTFVFTNTANTFSGELVINNGTLDIDHTNDMAVGNATGDDLLGTGNVTVGANGVLDITVTGANNSINFDSDLFVASGGKVVLQTVSLNTNSGFLDVFSGTLRRGCLVCQRRSIAW